MSNQLKSARSNEDARVPHNTIPLPSTRSYSTIGSTSNVAAARSRLIAAAEQYRKRRALTADEYYGGGTREAPVYSALCANLHHAVVTRNHYGCLVLNAHRTLFIDVDVLAPADSSLSCREPRQPRHSWKGTLDDLKTVLASEPNEGFRIYRTAAGFRVIATAHEFEPGSPHAQRLMETAGADAAFVNLCRLQKNFRARLTPKPWRCGTTRPPKHSPDGPADEQQRFDQWLRNYEYACRAHATCRYVGHVGANFIHPHIAPILEFHDSETKVNELLPLA